MSLVVAKFGGASIKDPTALRRLPELLATYTGQPLVIVVSAMGKTTNALEALANAAVSGDHDACRSQFEAIRSFHLHMVDGAFESDTAPVLAALKPFFTELWEILEGLRLLGEFPTRTFDRIMAFGELLSSTIVAHYLQSVGLPVRWQDARALIVTDTQFGSASVRWRKTAARVAAHLAPTVAHDAWVLTQGYIARTESGSTTVLGREGSDFTAAILGSLLGADRVDVWKDVPAVMSANPRTDPQAAVELPLLSYAQAVTMTFYGATVLHPKSLKPLENKGIPLWVRSFVTPSAAGTRIGSHGSTPSLPAEVLLRRSGLSLLSLRVRDLAFVDSRQLEEVLSATERMTDVLLVQAGALSLQLVVSARAQAIEQFSAAVADTHSVAVTPHVALVSVLWAKGALQHTPPANPLLCQQLGDCHHWVVHEEV